MLFFYFSLNVCLVIKYYLIQIYVFSSLNSCNSSICSDCYNPSQALGVNPTKTKSLKVPSSSAAFISLSSEFCKKQYFFNGSVSTTYNKYFKTLEKCSIPVRLFYTALVLILLFPNTFSTSSFAGAGVNNVTIGNISNEVIIPGR